MPISSVERFLDICHFKRPNDLCLIPDIRFGDKDEVMVNWIKQGAPKEISTRRFQEEFFQFQPIRPLVEIVSGDCYLDGRVEVPQRLFDLGNGITVPPFGSLAPLVPEYEHRLISSDERSVTYVNNRGQTVKRLRESIRTGWGMPEFLDWPVKDRATWNEVKKRLDPFTSERWPADWDNYVQKINKIGEETPISLSVGSFYGFSRELIGTEKVLYMFYDDPGLIEDIMETTLNLEIEVIKRVFKDIKVHMAAYWEDMCYKGGPLISPTMVRKYMMPRYKKINDLLHSYGIDVIFVDSDGNVEKMIPLWLESGVNFVWPFEVAAGNDVVAMRKEYGEELIIGGGIDKRALVKGKDAIREEVMSKVPFLLEKGGYFPSVDFGVTTDITYENYCYYINLLREIAGLEKLKV